jgi:hypothetical protein
VEPIRSHADSTVTIQVSSQSVPSTSAWLGEVVAFAQVLTHEEILKAITDQVRFARFSQYKVIDFVVVLRGLAEICLISAPLVNSDKQSATSQVSTINLHQKDGALWFHCCNTAHL